MKRSSFRLRTACAPAPTCAPTRTHAASGLAGGESGAWRSVRGADGGVGCGGQLSARHGTLAPATAPAARRDGGLVAAPFATAAAYLALPRPAGQHLHHQGRRAAGHRVPTTAAPCSTPIHRRAVRPRHGGHTALWPRQFHGGVGQGPPFVARRPRARRRRLQFRRALRRRNCVMLFSGLASVNLNNEIRRLVPGERMSLMATVAAIDRQARRRRRHSGRTVFETPHCRSGGGNG